MPPLYPGLAQASKDRRDESPKPSARKVRAIVWGGSWLDTCVSPAALKGPWRSSCAERGWEMDPGILLESGGEGDANGMEMGRKGNWLRTN